MVNGFNGFVAGRQAFETAMKLGMEAASQAFGFGDKLGSSFPTAVAGGDIARSLDEATAQSRENAEAILAASAATARGAEEFAAELTTLSRTAIDDTAAATRQILAATTLDQMLAVQTALATKAVESYVTESTRLGSLGVRLAQQAYEPIGARMQAAFDRATRIVGA